MADFRLTVFYTVARRLSFSKAAEELYISQPAVTKHIRELEHQYNNKLFDRKGNKIGLTSAGQVLLNHTESLFAIYRSIDFDMNALLQKHAGILHLGASTTISQYLIAPILAGFKKKFSDIELKLITGNTEQVEKALLKKEIELGIVEGRSKNLEISYSDFMQDEIVLVCNKQHPLAKTSEITPEQLKEHRFIVREQGSGTRQVIDHALKTSGLTLADLRIEIQLGNTESIKSYLMHSSTLAFLSVHSISRELLNGDLRVIDIQELSITRSLHFIHLQGHTDVLSEKLMRFARLHYNMK
ncbi:LysR family transcriptional regulator [Pedobacter africanus]|uniref:DNA-binding transcriptional regulator, LysR family n=1 Tax=Pedobacter africanus TaxID=151894 RepID=A0A1W2B376_9SPHI|nr:LysR family transcriptional regulator [Pedobacter africanus]SMC67399.1 DNA-binding transcriptional regulator, LysR family [Pedobacter africanus]